MRALLIDPFKREIREVEGDFNKDYTQIKQYLGEGQLGGKRAPFCAGPRLGENVHTYVDDEGFYRPDQAWFWIRGYGSPLAGYCLILGDNGPDEADLPDYVTIEKVAAIVMWTDAGEAQMNVPPITVTTLDRELKPTKVVSETPIDFKDKRPLR